MFMDVIVLIILFSELKINTPFRAIICSFMEKVTKV